MSEIHNLKFRQGDFELDVPNLSISDVGITALVGASGSGKSTFLRCLIGLNRAKNWSWIFKGEDLAKLSPSERKLGVVFQKLDLFPHMKSIENLYFATDARRMSRAEANTRIADLSAMLNMESFLNRPAYQLSGGEAQRVALARAVIAKPRFLLLDEPFSSLDPHLKEEARKLVKLLITQEKIPSLLVTHDQEDMNHIAQYVINMVKGTVTPEILS